MESVLLYFLKVIVCSGVMFLYYRLSLKDKTFHHYNRFYLLSAMLISLLLPLIKVDDFTIEVNNDVYRLIDKLQNFNTTKNISNGYPYFRIIFSALELVSLYFLGKLAYGIFRIRQLKSQFQKEHFDGINFYHTNLAEAPFSYFKNLFWKNSIGLNSEVGKQILKHEMVHIEQKHSFDKIFIEIITSIFWFNPFFHIIKKEINLIHEYLADHKAVKQSDTKAFAQMLLASHFSGTQLPATSPFLSSNLKKRLKMLQKPKTKFGYARRIFALPVLFAVAFTYMVNAKNKEIKQTNIAIEEAVSQIKKDTVKSEITQDVAAIEPGSFDRSETKKKITALGNKIQEKSKALKNLNPDSEEFKKKVDELGVLSAEIGEITSSDSFKNAYSLDPKDLKKINDFFKSDEWKNKMSELKKLHIEMPEMPELNVEFPEAPPVPPTPPNSPNSPKTKVSKTKDYVVYQNWSHEVQKEAIKAQKEGEKARNRGEIALAEGERARRAGEKARMNGELRRAAGEIARIAGEKARLEGEKARLEGEKVRKEARIIMTGDAKVNSVYVYNSSIKAPSSTSRDQTTMLMHADFIKKDGNGNVTMNGIKGFKLNDTDDMKIFVDGKQVTKEEFDALKVDNFAKININKYEGGNVKKGEIRIQTKK